MKMSAAPGDMLSSSALHMAVIVVAALIAYSNTFSAPFVFDDQAFIINNPAMKDWGSFAALTHETPGPGRRFLIHFNDRLLVFASFALNWQMGGGSVGEFHAFNLVVHAASAVTLYWLALMLFGASALSPPGGEGSLRIAAFWAAAVFAVHPVQTEAVTYISQRFTSMVGLFYLLALALYVRSRLDGPGSRRSHVLYALSVVCVLAAVRSKETAFTLPAAMVLVDVFFLGGVRGIRPSRLLPWAAAVMIIPATLVMAGAHSVGETVNAANIHSISPWGYLLSEQRVLLTYMRLLAFPAGLNFDYDYPFYTSLLQWPVMLSVLINAGLVAVAVWLYRYSSRATGRAHWRWASFGILWFYLTLAVESSIVPLNDLVYEHRLYLPMAGVTMAAAALGLRFCEVIRSRAGRRALNAGAAAVVLVFVALTYSRNAVYGDLVGFWEDAARKSPEKLRVLNNLGMAYGMAGKPQEGIPVLERAASLLPARISAGQDVMNDANRVTVLNNLGLAYASAGDNRQAIAAYERAVSMFPPDVASAGAPYHLEAPTTLRNLAIAYYNSGDAQKAVSALQYALRIDPSNPDVLDTLAAVNSRMSGGR